MYKRQDENPDPNADFPRMWPGNAGKGTVSVLDLGNHNFYMETAPALKADGLENGYKVLADFNGTPKCGA